MRNFGKGIKPEMHRAVCDKCGKDCEVPFKPTGDKPVFCSNCFEKPDRGGRGNDSRRSSFGDRRTGRPEMHGAVCDKCGKDCEVPFKPTGDKPIYCSNCFDKGGNSGGGGRGRDRDGGSDKVSQQLEALNTKLDKILEVLTTGSKPSKKETAKPAAKKTVAKKPAVKKKAPAKKKATAKKKK